MSEETTGNMPDSRSFEERVFARFDAIDTRLSEMDTRLSVLEQKAYDTKPIWERALSEILAVSQKLETVERKLNVLGLDMLALRADQTRLEDRMDKLESKPVQ
jgi:chromosome segregation ATPase